MNHLTRPASTYESEESTPMFAEAMFEFVRRYETEDTAIHSAACDCLDSLCPTGLQQGAKGRSRRFSKPSQKGLPISISCRP